MIATYGTRIEERFITKNLAAIHLFFQDL